MGAREKKRLSVSKFKMMFLPFTFPLKVNMKSKWILITVSVQKVSLSHSNWSELKKKKKTYQF